jgi:hypothetical protein
VAPTVFPRPCVLEPLTNTRPCRLTGDIEFTGESAVEPVPRLIATLQRGAAPATPCITSTFKASAPRSAYSPRLPRPDPPWPPLLLQRQGVRVVWPEYETGKQSGKAPRSRRL